MGFILYKLVTIKFSDHASEVLVDRKIREKDIYKSLERGQIVDYRVIYDKYDNICDHRITVRSTYLKRGKEVMYISLSLDNPFIITLFYDYADKMLNKYSKDKYDENIKIIR